jgi:hypothetical protein
VKGMVLLGIVIKKMKKLKILIEKLKKRLDKKDESFICLTVGKRRSGMTANIIPDEWLNEILKDRDLIDLWNPIFLRLK